MGMLLTLKLPNPIVSLSAHYIQMRNNYLQSAIQQFESYKALGEKAMAQVGDKGLLWQYNQDSNSIAIIVKHLWGNMLSRWTDFLTSDGEKEWRKRDEEFENDVSDRKELLEKWNEGWNRVLQAMNSLHKDDLEKTVLIRGERHSVIEAVNRQLTHYAYHVGQMVFIAKDGTQ
jgi:hypothetical protein